MGKWEGKDRVDPIFFTSELIIDSDISLLADDLITAVRVKKERGGKTDFERHEIKPLYSN